jgi:hypothetical protein
MKKRFSEPDVQAINPRTGKLGGSVSGGSQCKKHHFMKLRAK